MWKGFFSGIIFAVSSIASVSIKQVVPLATENRCMQKLNSQLALTQARPYCSCVSQELSEVGIIKIYQAKNDINAQNIIRTQVNQKCGIMPQ